MVFCLPNTEATTEGNKLKKEPHPMPLMTQNRERMPMLDAKGQMASALTLLKRMAKMVLLTGPRNESAVKPAKMRPTVDEMFHMVRAMMPVELDWLMDWAKTGMK